jgi:hypothetical protein
VLTTPQVNLLLVGAKAVVLLELTHQQIVVTVTRAQQILGEVEVLVQSTIILEAQEVPELLLLELLRQLHQALDLQL